MTEEATSTRPPGVQARDDPGWRTPVLLYLGVLLVLLLVSWQTIDHVAEHGRIVDYPRFRGDWFWGGWMRLDGAWYFDIASRGYTYVPGQQTSVAFFPAYPLVVRALGRRIDNVALGGILVTIGCGLVALSLFWRWCATFLPRRSAVFGVAALALYPYAWYLYGAVYGDALFLLAVIGSFLLFERGHLVLAGLLGAVATSTRLVGVALVIGLVVGVLERRGAFTGRWRWELPRRVQVRRVRLLRLTDAGVLLAPLGLVAWCAWLWHRFGDPFLFSSVQEYWGQPASLRTWFKVDFAAQLVNGTDRIYATGLLVQALLALGVVLLIPAVIRRFGLRYGAYQAVLVLVPALGSQDFQGVGRYLIAAFPAFAVVGAHLADRPRLARVALPASGAALALGTAWFAHGLYLA